jgi:hypothetical protein
MVDLTAAATTGIALVMMNYAYSNDAERCDAAKTCKW